MCLAVAQQNLETGHGGLYTPMMPCLLSTYLAWQQLKGIEVVIIATPIERLCDPTPRFCQMGK